MTELGYALSYDEHHPADLVHYAAEAAAAGFTFALVSDHFHPWIDAQGESPFVWSVIGAEAGFDHVYIHQVGSDQDGFLRFAKNELVLATR